MARALLLVAFLALSFCAPRVSASAYASLSISTKFTSDCCPDSNKVESIEVCVTIKSSGPAHGVQFTDTIPNGLRAISVSATSGGSCSISGSSISCSFDEIMKKATVTFMLEDASGADLIPLGKYVNKVVANGVYAQSTYNTQDCSTVKDDPHFVGAHGVTFDFNGLPDSSFCLISDTDIHINMLVNGYYGGDHAHTLENAHHAKDPKAISAMKDGDAHAELYTWIRELMIFWNVDGKQHSLHLAARGGNQKESGDGFLKVMELDGKALPRMAEGASFEDEESQISLSFSYETATQWDGKGHYDVDFYKLSIGELLNAEIRLRVAHPTFQIANDVETHINLKIAHIKLSDDVHGVLGQTYRDDRADRTALFKKIVKETHQRIKADKPSGKGFLDGETVDYLTSDLSATDCKFNRFTAVTPISVVPGTTE